MNEAFWLGAGRWANSHDVPNASSRVAIGPLADRSAQFIEESIAGIEPVQDTLWTQVAAREDRLRPVFSDDLLEAAADFLQGRLPAYALELSASLWASAPQGVEHAVGTIDPVRVVVHFHAESTSRERMIRIATYFDGTPIFYSNEHGASIWTIMRTGSTNNNSFDGSRTGHSGPPAW